LSDLIIQKKEYLTKMALASLKRTANEYVNLSQICHEYHNEFGYQDYEQWIKNDLGLGITRGKQLLTVYDQFGVTPQSGVDYLPVATMFLLAAPSVPESARTEAIEKAENGEKLTIKQTKELVEAHKRIGALEKDLSSAKVQIPTEDIKAKILDLEARLEAEKNKPAEIQYQEKIPEDYEELKNRKDELAHERMQLKSEMAQMKANHDLEIKKIAEAIPAGYADLSLAKDALTRDKNTLVARLKEIHEENTKLSEQVKRLTRDYDGKLAQLVEETMRELQDEFDTKEKELASVQAMIEKINTENEKLTDKVKHLTKEQDGKVAQSVTLRMRKIQDEFNTILSDLFDVDIPESANKDLMIQANEMAQGAAAFKNFLMCHKWETATTAFNVKH
jgi:DNA repair exonuclease SbcCD ATPase subunit